MPPATDADIRRSHGRRIAEKRAAANLTQAQLAGEIGVSHQSVSMWESGLTSPTPARMVALADVFGCRTADLFNLDDLAEEAS